jgi:hypothetical protein
MYQTRIKQKPDEYFGFNNRYCYQGAVPVLRVRRSIVRQGRAERNHIGYQGTKPQAPAILPQHKALPLDIGISYSAFIIETMNQERMNGGARGGNCCCNKLDSRAGLNVVRECDFFGGVRAAVIAGSDLRC